MEKLVLNRDEYFQVVSLTQLVSIDILVIYGAKLLVGERINNPAKGSFFCPRRESLQKRVSQGGFGENFGA